MPHFAPPAVVLHRRESPPRTGTMLAPLLVSRNPVEAIAPQGRMQPQNDIPAACRPSRRFVFMSLAIKSYLAVSQQENFVRMAAPTPHAHMPRGKMAPVRSRGNIRSGRPGSFGSRFALAPTDDDQLTPIYAGLR